MKWITRERPKIDRIACPWLVARIIDDALYARCSDTPLKKVGRLLGL